MRIGDRAYVLSGLPGSGKSTTAAAFNGLGYTVLSDDMVAIRMGPEPQVLPAFPQVKILPEVARGLGYDESSLPEVFPGSHKKVIRNREHFPVEPLPLGGIFFLDRAAEIRISSMPHAEAMLALVRFFPCPSDVLSGSQQRAHFEQCQRLAASAWKLELPRSFPLLRKLVSWLAEQIAAGGSESFDAPPVAEWDRSPVTHV